MPAIVPVALISIAKAGLAQALWQAWQTARPELASLLADPNGTIARVGDALIWSGPSGQKVLGSLEMLADSHERIEKAVNGIETAQVAMQGALGVVQSLSIATLGITALSAAFMAYRLQALTKRIDTLGAAIKDVEGKIDAEHKALLKNSLIELREYDNSPSKDKLKRAFEKARDAAGIYGQLASDEADGKARLPVLNCRGRFYVVSLLTEIRCMMSSDQPQDALDRINEEMPHLTAVAKVSFTKTLGSDPERYLRACFQQHDVNLNLLTHIYQQAKQLGISDQPAVADANGMFDYVRANLQKGNGFLGHFRRNNVEDELQKLRYLLACLEETGRVAGLGLMIEEVQNQKGSLAELVAKLKEWRQTQEGLKPGLDAPLAHAWAF